MRSVVYYLAGLLLFCLACYACLKRMAIDYDGTTISQAITLAGVRRQMVRIADAEREYIIANQEGCVPIEQLMDEDKLDAGSDKRAGYTFSIQCSDPDFTVVGVHGPMPRGSHLRFPNLVLGPDSKFRKLKLK